MKRISIECAQRNIEKIFEEVNKTSSSLLLTNENGNNCYLVGEETFNSLLETISIYSIEGLAESIVHEGKSSYEDALEADKLDW